MKIKIINKETISTPINNNGVTETCISIEIKFGLQWVYNILVQGVRNYAVLTLVQKILENIL